MLPLPFRCRSGRYLVLSAADCTRSRLRQRYAIAKADFAAITSGRVREARGAVFPAWRQRPAPLSRDRAGRPFRRDSASPERPGTGAGPPAPPSDRAPGRSGPRLLVAERPDREDALPAGDLAADHPIQRAAVDQLVRALRHHARAVDVLGLFAALSFLLELLPDPVFEVANGIGADAELDEMKGHAGTLASPPRSITIICAPSTTCRAFGGCNLFHDAGKRCAQRMFHLHGFDHGKTLTLRHRLA